MNWGLESQHTDISWEKYWWIRPPVSVGSFSSLPVFVASVMYGRNFSKLYTNIHKLAGPIGFYCIFFSYCFFACPQQNVSRSSEPAAMFGQMITGNFQVSSHTYKVWALFVSPASAVIKVYCDLLFSLMSNFFSKLLDSVLPMKIIWLYTSISMRWHWSLGLLAMTV